MVCAEYNNSIVITKRIRIMVTTKQERFIASRLKSFEKGAQERGRSFKLDYADAKVLLLSPCFYCGDSGLKIMSIDRTDNNLGYEKDNVKSCCKTCNMAKGRRTEEEFIVGCLNVTRHMALSLYSQIPDVVLKIESSRKKIKLSTDTDIKISEMLKSYPGNKCKASQLMRRLGCSSAEVNKALDTLESGMVVKRYTKTGRGRPAQIIELIK